MVAVVPREVLENSPSVEDGVDAQAEEELRRFGATRIQLAGLLLKVPQLTIASAQALFQHFYFRRSFADTEVRSAAAAALALACKVEETHRRLHDVIIVCHRVQLRSMLASEEDGGSPLFENGPTPLLDTDSKEYTDYKREVVRAERVMLQELGYEVFVFLDHPHKHLLEQLGVLGIRAGKWKGYPDTPSSTAPGGPPSSAATGASASTSSSPGQGSNGESKLTGAWAQTAWGYLNDVLRTSLCCEHPPQYIAAAALFLAARCLAIKLPTRPTLWDALDVPMPELEHIAEAIMALYRRPPAQYISVPRRRKEPKEPPPLPPATPADAPGPPTASPESDEEGTKSGLGGGISSARGAALDSASVTILPEELEKAAAASEASARAVPKLAASASEAEDGHPVASDSAAQPTTGASDSNSERSTRNAGVHDSDNDSPTRRAGASDSGKDRPARKSKLGNEGPRSKDAKVDRRKDEAGHRREADSVAKKEKKRHSKGRPESEQNRNERDKERRRASTEGISEGKRKRSRSRRKRSESRPRKSEKVSKTDRGREVGATSGGKASAKAAKEADTKKKKAAAALTRRASAVASPSSDSSESESQAASSSSSGACSEGSCSASESASASCPSSPSAAPRKASRKAPVPARAPAKKRLPPRKDVKVDDCDL